MDDFENGYVVFNINNKKFRMLFVLLLGLGFVATTTRADSVTKILLNYPNETVTAFWPGDWDETEHDR